MKVVLRPEMQKYVREKVKAGHYADASVLVNEALDVLRDQEQFSAKQAVYFRREVQRGLDQLDRRELSEFTAETIIARGTIPSGGEYRCSGFKSFIRRRAFTSTQITSPMTWKC
jgi:putative addiction module CopG family antidote